MSTFHASFSEQSSTFSSAFSENETLSASFDEVIMVADADVYEGDYTVVPKAHEETVLETEGLLMADDVTVLQVPYYETSNTSGYTAYIASEV